MENKVIFIDVDGVLNSSDCYDKETGVDLYFPYIKNLYKIVSKTNAALILTSTWKLFWNKENIRCDKSGKDLNEYLAKCNLYIKDTTKETNLFERGKGIRMYLDNHPEIVHYIVIDDEIFRDYEKYDILPHLIKTQYQDPNGGLRKEHVDKAIKLLNGDKT